MSIGVEVMSSVGGGIGLSFLDSVLVAVWLDSYNLIESSYSSFDGRGWSGVGSGVCFFFQVASAEFCGCLVWLSMASEGTSSKGVTSLGSSSLEVCMFNDIG